MAPGIPIHRVVRMLEEIGAFFGIKPVRAGSKPNYPELFNRFLRDLLVVEFY